MSRVYEKKTNILIVAITRLGDMLQASPTIVGLRKQHPEARITVVIDKQFAKICDGIPGIDEAYVLDLSYVCRCLHRENEGISDGFKYISDIVDDLKGREFDYALNMSNSPYTALLIKMLGVKDCRGWLSDDEGFRLMADPWAMLFAAFVYHSNRDYNSLNLVDIFRCAADVDQHPLKLEFNIPTESRDFAKRFLTEHNLQGTGPLICVQAGASQEKRQWAPVKFGRLLQLLVEELGARVILTGAGSEQHIIDAIFSHYTHPRLVSSVGKTNFQQLGGLLEKADLLITGDTGPMHVSVAVGTPVVALFLASALCHETGPYSAGNFVLQPQINCNPCNPNYPCSRPDCHDQITPELVAYLAQLRLATPIGGEGEISISPKIADPNQVVVYYSAFDQDRFLEFISLNGMPSRHGEPTGYYFAARRAYRELWKEELADIPFAKIPPRNDNSFPPLHTMLQGIHLVTALADEGARCVSELVSLIRDVTSPTEALGEINQKLQFLDKEIEQVSLSYPVLGALIRVSIMERENMRGADPMKLALETGEIYSRLNRRGRRFAHLFCSFYQQIRDDVASSDQVFIRSEFSQQGISQ